MELLYAYAEKYRIFEHQEFSFSDRFRVHFNEKDRKLTIEKNEDYFDLYPGNILGITAVVGKNASGKTSLLSMIGDRVETRNLTEGLDPSAPEQYFMIHWLEQKDGTDTFLFETNEFAAFQDLFEGSTPDSSSSISGSKGRKSIVFQCLKDSDVPIQNWYEFKDGLDQIYPVNMLFFQNGLDKYYNNEDHVGRREAPLVLNAQYQELEMLVDKIRHNAGRESMFGNANYQCRIQIVLSVNHRSRSKQQVALPSKIQEIQNMPESEIPQFLAFGLMVQQQFRMVDQFCSEKGPKLSVEFLNQCDRIAENMEHMNPLDALILANQQLSNLKFPGQKPSLLWRSYWKLLRYNEKKYRILTNMLQGLIFQSDQHDPFKALGDKIIYQFNFQIGAETDISFLKPFFDEMKFLGIPEEYVRTEIGPFSDGERENLAMYSSIHAQLVDEYIDSGSCILLFDEIERCMHPEMCRCLITDLMEFLRGYPDKKFQIIIASHSPFIVGDLRQENLICLTKDGKVYQPEEKPFGQNIHTLLKSQFFLDNTFSGYACTMIDLVADCLASRVEKGREIWNSLEQMREKIRNHMECRDQQKESEETLCHRSPEDFSWKRLPSNDQETLQFLEQTIEAVGEPLLRRSLQDDLERWKNRNDTRSWKLARREVLMKQLQELDEQLRKE